MMGIYGNIVAIVYALSALGLGIATVALLFSGMRGDLNYYEFARRLMAIAAGVIASGVVLLPLYKLFADFAEGAELLSFRALILGGLLPCLLGAALGLLGNRLLKERSVRSVRLLILLNAAFGTYMLIGIADVYATAQIDKDLQGELSARLGRVDSLVTDLGTSVGLVYRAASMASKSLQKTEETSESVQLTLDNIRTRIEREPESATPDSYTYSNYSLVDRRLYNLASELETASATLREAIRSQGFSINCEVDSHPCLDTLLSNISKASREAKSIEKHIKIISTEIASDQEQKTRGAVLAILPSLVFIMAAFVVITLAKE